MIFHVQGCWRGFSHGCCRYTWEEEASWEGKWQQHLKGSSTCNYYSQRNSLPWVLLYPNSKENSSEEFGQSFCVYKIVWQWTWDAGNIWVQPQRGKIIRPKVTYHTTSKFFGRTCRTPQMIQCCNTNLQPIYYWFLQIAGATTTISSKSFYFNKLWIRIFGLEFGLCICKACKSGSGRIGKRICCTQLQFRLRILFHTDLWFKMCSSEMICKMALSFSKPSSNPWLDAKYSASGSEYHCKLWINPDQYHLIKHTDQIG